MPQLARLHIEYESLEPWKLKYIESPGKPLKSGPSPRQVRSNRGRCACNCALRQPPTPSRCHLQLAGSLPEWRATPYLFVKLRRVLQLFGLDLVVKDPKLRMIKIDHIGDALHRCEHLQFLVR